MENMEMKVVGKKLTITVDLAKTIGKSKSGDSDMIASSKGNQPVPGFEEIKVGLNIYKPAKS